LLSYVVRRVLTSGAVVLGLTLLVFLLQHLVANGTNLARAVMGPKASASSIAAFVRQYGLSRPLPDQYLSYLNTLLHGDLGYSYKLNQSVTSVLREDVPKDIVLVGSALIIALLVAIPLGIFQALHVGRVSDHAATGVSFLLYSMPSFWLGMLLIGVFAVSLHWFPTEGPQGQTIGQLISDPRALVLPIATLTLVNYALFSRYMRSAALDVMVRDYIVTARAKGSSTRHIVRLHLLRNSIAPIVTLVGLSLPGVLTAGVITEYVFNFPGTGLAFLNAAITDDYPLQLGIIVMVGIVTVAGNLLADLGYAVLDPRVRYA